MDNDAAQYAQQVLIEFYELRFGTQIFDSVAKTLKAGQPALIEDMQYRVT